MPDRIQNAPVLIDGLGIYLEAFFELDTERSHGMGLTRIPWTAIKAYSDHYEFDERQADDLMFFIRRMDSAHLERLDNKT